MTRAKYPLITKMSPTPNDSFNSNKYVLVDKSTSINLFYVIEDKQPYPENREKGSFQKINKYFISKR